MRFVPAINKISFLILCATIMSVVTTPLYADDYLIDCGETHFDSPEALQELVDEWLKPIDYGDPVLLKNGEYTLSVTDLAIEGRALSVIIKRHYRSRSEYNSCFGYGWDMSYNMKVRKLHDPNTLVLLNSQNMVLDYTKDPNSDPNEPEYLGPTGHYDYVVENQDGTFTLVKKYGTKLDFDINGNLTEIYDRNGNYISFTYDANGLLPINGPSKYFVGQNYGLIAREYKLKKITDDLDRDIIFTYDANGLLLTIIDFAARTWVYDYNSVTNDLISVTGPNTPEYPSGLIETYTYDANHNLLTCTDPNGQTYLTNVYDSNGYVTSQAYGDGTYIFSYTPDSNQTIATDREGFNTTAVYNGTGNPLTVTIDTNDLRASDPNSYTTSYEYNFDMDITKKTLPAGNWIEYTYDANGNVLTICSEPNNGDPNIIITYTYDPNYNFVETMTDPLGNVTTYDYDPNGNLTSVTSPTVNIPGDGDVNATVRFVYNSYGQIETATAPDGIVTKYEYYTDSNDANNFGKLYKTIADYNTVDGLNITTSYEYDELGRVIEVNDPNGDKMSFVYNDLDQLTKTTAASPYNYVTNFSYNDRKKLSQTERVRIADSNQVTSYTYNILDKLQKVTDPLGNFAINSYDKNDNLSDINDAEENNTNYQYDERDLLWKVTDANGNVTEYSYTLNGLLARITAPDGNETTYTYDGFNRKTMVAYPDDSNEQFSYNKNSNLTSYKNRAGDTINYEYDALNRMTVKNRPSDPNIVYRYDILGRVYDVNDERSVSQGGGITSFTYDRTGRVTDVNDSEDRLVSYDYDERSLRTKLTYPDDTNVTYSYDTLGRVININYEGNTITEFAYDELSRRTLLTLGNDANAVYDYDLNNRLTKLTNNIDDTNSITFDYANYDNIGNRLSYKIDDANAHVYTYDEIYRLVFVDYNDGNSTSYAYDSLGNRTDVNDGTSTAYTTDANGLNQYSNVGDVNYLYDDNGNLTDDGMYEYYYDCENRLIDVNQDSNSVASYKYDYLSRRVAKVVDGNTTRYCYDGGQVIAEYKNDTLVRKFIYGPGIDEPIMMIVVNGETETQYYYHFDGLGSVVALSDSYADVIEKYSYDVFGEPNRTSDVNNPYMFTGRRYDPEDGLYYYRARYYAHDIGRFLQTDPIGYVDSINLYSYVGNNPLAWIDPSGLSKEDNSERIKRLQDYIKSAEAGVIANIEILEGLHAKIRSTHTYYRNVLIADTALSVFTVSRSALKIAGGIGQMRSASQSLGTNLLQETAFGPGRDVAMRNLGERLALKGVNEFLTSDAVVLYPMSKLAPQIINVEITIAGARQKMVTRYENHAQAIMANIYTLSQGISQAQEMLK